MHLVQDRAHWLTVTNTVMNLLVHKTYEKYFAAARMSVSEGQLCPM
jgi:hypothetical protein